MWHVMQRGRLRRWPGRAGSTWMVEVDGFQVVRGTAVRSHAEGYQLGTAYIDKYEGYVRNLIYGVLTTGILSLVKLYYVE